MSKHQLPGDKRPWPYKDNGPRILSVLASSVRILGTAIFLITHWHHNS